LLNKNKTRSKTMTTEIYEKRLMQARGRLDALQVKLNNTKKTPREFGQPAILYNSKGRAQYKADQKIEARQWAIYDKIKDEMSYIQDLENKIEFAKDRQELGLKYNRSGNIDYRHAGNLKIFEMVYDVIKDVPKHAAREKIKETLPNIPYHGHMNNKTQLKKIIEELKSELQYSI
jgi:hypothetical protein